MESNGLLYGGREIDLLDKIVGQLKLPLKEVPETTSMQTERAAEVLLPLTCFIVLLLSVIQRFFI